MDLIAALAGQLGLDPRKAEAVAGAVLGAAREQVPDDETQKLDDLLPEIGKWQATADTVLAEADPAGAPEGLLGTLTQLAGSGLGNQLLGAIGGAQAQETATAVALLGKLGLQPSHAALAAPVVLKFLEERVGKEWTDRIVSAAPMLSSLMGSTRKDTSVASVLGSLLK